MKLTCPFYSKSLEKCLLQKPYGLCSEKTEKWKNKEHFKCTWYLEEKKRLIEMHERGEVAGTHN